MRAYTVNEMAVNSDDKYYASSSLVNYVVDTAINIIGKENISEIIEPSAGDGAFIEKLESLNIPTQYYDLYPEHHSIKKQDFSTLNLPYKKGRLFLGGPPYAKASNLWKMFVKQAAKMGDYIAYISPPNFHEINPFPQFLDILHTEQLPVQKFLGSKERGEKDVFMKSSYNIYKVNHKKELQLDPLDNQLNQDFIIGTYNKSDEKKRKTPQRKYEYYVTAWGIIGNWFEYPKNESNIGIIVKNEDMREKFEEWLDNFKSNYFDYFDARSTGAPRIQIDIFKKLIKKDLY